MSFSTMNGINAARTGGLEGTRRLPLAGQQPLPGTPLPQPQAGTYAQPQNPRQGLMGTAPALAGSGMYASAQPQTGIQPGRPPAPYQASPGPQFDPNDPRNAALAGYMNGA
jgi:hypothetical protein